MSSFTPPRSLAQRQVALEKANDVRSRRAQLKRDLKAGRKRATDQLLDPPDWLATMKVFDLLLAMPKQGRVKVNKHLSLCRVSPSKTIGGLSSRQRADLVRLLRPRDGMGVRVASPHRLVLARSACLEHLAKANTIRLRRAELAAQIASGETTVAELLLAEPVPAMMTWPVGELLACQRRWGAKRARKVLWACQISETKAVSALTERQRRLLARLLDAAAETRVAA